MYHEFMTYKTLEQLVDELAESLQRISELSDISKL